MNACHVSHRYQRGPRGHTARGCDKTSIMGEREWEWAGEICRFVATNLAGIGGIASTPLKTTKTCSKMKNNAFNLKWYIHDLRNAFKSGCIVMETRRRLASLLSDSSVCKKRTVESSDNNFSNNLNTLGSLCIAFSKRTFSKATVEFYMYREQMFSVTGTLWSLKGNHKVIDLWFCWVRF